MEFLFWALIILLLNASNTALTRARSSGSIRYHVTMSAIAGIVWIFNQLLSVNILVDIWKRKAWLLFGIVGVFYVILTVIGSVSSHWFLMHHYEKGKLRVGER